MSLFEWNEQEQQDYENWMTTVKAQISENVLYKSFAWSFNFKTGAATNKDRFHWEEIKVPCQRLSTNMRSTISTLPTLGEDELLEDIPSISDLDIRISLELTKSPIVLLPHKSCGQASQIRMSENLRENQSCAGCFVGFEEGESVQTNPCGHKFHLRCLQSAQRSLPGCYFCRSEFRGK